MSKLRDMIANAVLWVFSLFAATLTGFLFAMRIV